MLRVLPPMIEPDTWTLAFHTTSRWWWVRLLAWGCYKHVSTFAFVPAYRMWVYYDITLFGTKIMLIPDSETAEAWLMAQTEDADLLQMPRRICKSYAPVIAPFYCVPAVKHLIGLRSGALLPDTLFRDCLRTGGVLIHGRAGEATTVAGAGRLAAPGAAGPH